MLVAGIQHAITWENPEANFARVRPMIAEAARRGCRLAVLPEMFAVGFTMAPEKAIQFAAMTSNFLSSSAREERIYILGGYPDAGQPRPRNKVSVFDDAGKEVAQYSKVHPFTLAGEHLHYSGGESGVLVEIDGVRVALIICYDLRFPEMFRATVDFTHLYCVSANWPTPRRRIWMTLLEARAIENQAYVLGVNRIGECDGLNYSGDSRLIDPMGQIIEDAADREGIFCAEVNPETVCELRRRFSFVADRRPEVYERVRRELIQSRITPVADKSGTA